MVGLLLVAVAVRFLRRRRRPPQPETRFRVAFDASEIWVTCPDTGRKALKWADLTQVGIRTSAVGPWSPDVFWGLHDASGVARLVFPNGAEGVGALLEEFGRRLPGLRHEELLRALRSTEDAGFLIWERAETPPSGTPPLLH